MAKLLVNKLKLMIEYIISPGQYGFIQGHSLITFLLQMRLLIAVKKKVQECFLFKVDF